MWQVVTYNEGNEREVETYTDMGVAYLRYTKCVKSVLYIKVELYKMGKMIVSNKK
jgi:hypothetical protein